MERARYFLAGCLLWAAGAAAWSADVPLPAGARVGIMEMGSTDITHFHVGKTPVQSFMRTYRVSWPVGAVIDDPLAAQLKSAGFEAVFIDPTDPLRHERQAWFVANPQAGKLPRACLEEIGKVLTDEKLSALIIIAPGSNSSPESVQGNRLRKLPSYLQGWGFSTSDEPGGTDKPVVFNLTQMVLVRKGEDGAELGLREWGGSYVYEWATFDPGPDLKTLPASEIDKFRAVINDVIQRQIARVIPHLKPGG